MRLQRHKNVFFLWISLGVFFLWSGNAISENSGGKEPGSGKAKVSFLQGQVEMLAKGDRTWKPLKTGSFLSAEDEVRTGDNSRVEIQLPDNSILRFDQRTVFKMKAVVFNLQEGSREIKVQLTLGKTWANVRKVFGSQKTFEVASTNAVAGVRDTIWRMNVESDKAALIRVYEGMVEVYNPFVKGDYKPEAGGIEAPHEVMGPKEIPRPFEEITQEQWEEIILSQMMQVKIPASGKPDKPNLFNLEDDQKEEWVRWNQIRDKEIKP